MNQEKAQAAWNRIEALGGHGVWESDMVVISLAGAGVKDNDLAIFADFPFVQILSLADNALTDACLTHLEDLTALESLIVTGTQISPEAVSRFRSTHPTVNIVDAPPPPGTINPWTGKPIE